MNSMIWSIAALFKVFGAILETDTVDEEVSGRIGSILKQLQQPPFADVSTAAFQALPAPEQVILCNMHDVI